VPLGRPPSPEALELLDAAACGLLQTADDGTLLRVNRTFYAWLGYAADELVGRRRFQELLTMGGRIFHQTHWAPLLRMQGSVSEVKLEVLHRDGTRIPMVFNAIRHDQDGAMVHEIAAYVAHDRDKYERELVLSRQRLEVLVAEATQLQADAKDRANFAEQMIGIVSHDLRNPLSIIAMGAALLAHGSLSSGQRRTLDRITRATGRAGRLINDLLDFTQARLGDGLSVALAAVDLHESVAEAVDELALAYSGRALAHRRFGEGACLVDADRLTQLIGNLVANAMAYGDPAVTVTVTSTVHPATFEVAVHNAGAPIPQDTQASLFRPMERGTTLGSERRSVGLGLFIVREIARAHAGSVSLTSTPQDGTVFTAVFPRGAPAVREP
jgi:sigma-B regulation protein RsbU (phosphoserine phosphatase)